MKPVILTITPYKIREWLFARIFRARAKFHPQLFEDSPLSFAKNVRMRLLPSDIAHGCIAYTGVYELDLTRRIVKLAWSGGLLIDVGANFGYFSLLWADNGNGNHSVAFEASPRNVAALRVNIERNRLSERVRIRDCAVGRAKGLARFSLGPEEQTGWGGLSAVNAGATDVEVDVVTLDEEFADCPQIAVLKIDIEGADTWALQGADRLLRERRIRHVFFEQNRERMLALGIKENEAGDFLRARGYTVRCLTDHGGLKEFHAYADKL